MPKKDRLIKILKQNKINLLILSILIIHTLLSGRWWFWNIFSVVPPLFFTLLLISLLFWNIFTKNKLGIIFLVLATPLAILNSDININFINSVSGEQINTVKVFNFNTEYWESENIEDFYKFLKDQNADIYHLQEHITKDLSEIKDLEQLKSNFPGYNVIASAEFVTMSKFPIIQTYNSKGAYYLKNDIDINGNIISFYNVHIPVQLLVMQATEPVKFIKDLAFRFDWRERQFNLLLNDIQNNPSPYYISGDFNTTKSMGKMDIILNQTIDSFAKSNSLLPTTWDISGLKLWRIDYNLIDKTSNKLGFIRHEDIDPHEFSDHWGQLVTLKI